MGTNDVVGVTADVVGITVSGMTGEKAVVGVEMVMVGATTDASGVV